MAPDPRSGGTIAAVSTAPGRAGIGVLRISGPAAPDIAARIFRPARQTTASPLPLEPRRAVLGRIVDPESGAELDQVLVLWFPAPHSYTGEDLLEIHAHGGARNLSQILDLVLDSGARMAEPGEFTLRAFLCGKLDLVEAEAVADLIEADSAAAADAARMQRQGVLGEALGRLREAALERLVAIEAELDFPDEDEVHRAERRRQRAALDDLAERAGRLARSADWGERLLAGFRVVLIGLPNAGKSSLFNRLLGEQRALVHETAGTTRDVLEGRTECGGLPVVLVDGAGWNEAAQGLEREGQRLLGQQLEQASLAVVVVDGSRAPVPELQALLERLDGQARVLAVNKSDLGRGLDSPDDLAGGTPWIELSARSGEGVDALWTLVGRQLQQGREPGPLATRARHREGLQQAGHALAAAADLLGEPEGLERVAEELRGAVRALDRLLGRAYDDELLSRVFGRFCIGK